MLYMSSVRKSAPPEAQINSCPKRINVEVINNIEIILIILRDGNSVER